MAFSSTTLITWSCRCIYLVFLLLLGSCCQESVQTGEDHFQCGPLENKQQCLCFKKSKRMNCNGFSHAKPPLKTFNVDTALNWTWVEGLDLQENDLESVPNLTMFTSLKSLDLGANERISDLPKHSFAGLEQLEHLDLTQLSVTFQRGSVHKDIFRYTKQLQQLKMKQLQRVIPDDESDYSFLLPVKESLNLLYIVGNPNLAPVFNEPFPKLETLSLGGRYCNMTGFSQNGFKNITRSPLLKLSIRNCYIESIPMDFFQPVAKSLLKLDISCNPVHESLINVSTALEGGNLKTLVGDFINWKPEACLWNATSAYIPSTLQFLSLSANQINYFTLLPKSTAFLKNMKYFDISFNRLNGAGFNILFSECKDWFWCNGATPHQLQFFGLNGITHIDAQSCGQRPEKLDCFADSTLLDRETFEWEQGINPNYLDVFILVSFYDQMNRTAPTDMLKYRNSNFNKSSLSLKSIVRIMAEMAEKHHKVMVNFENLVRNLTEKGVSQKRALQTIAKYFCEDHHKRVFVEVMKCWIRLSLPDSNTWTNKAVSSTINELCRRRNLHYGLDYFIEDGFRRLFTNLTTITATANEGAFLKVPNRFCNDVKYFPLNSLRQITLSYSNLPYIACANITGLSNIAKIECRQCFNEGWNFTAADFPRLYYLDWSENKIGDRLREEYLVRDYTELTELNLSRERPSIKFFKHMDVFSSLKKLSRLYLDHNKIEVWNISLIDNTKLRYLYLRNNSIRFIENRWRKDLELAHNQSGLRIYLRENPIDCQCEAKNLDFIEWLLTSKVIADRDRSYLRCYYPNSALLKDFVHECSKPSKTRPQWKIIAISTSGGVVALVFLLTLGFMAKRVIRNCQLKGYQQLKPETLPKVFISFPRRMIEDINALKELTQNRMVLLSTDWDAMEGQLIVTILSELLQNTAKFILVVSDDYFHDDTASREFNLMENAGLLTKEKVVLILTSPSYRGNQLPTVLKEQYNAGEYLLWPMGLCSALEFKELAEDIVQKVTARND